MKIFLMGLTASGKTWQAQELAGYYNIHYYSGSKILEDNLMKSIDRRTHYWLGEEGEFLERARDSSNVDIYTDKQLCDIERRACCGVFDSWTLPWLPNTSGSGITKVFLDANLDERSSRAFNSRSTWESKKVDLQKEIHKKDMRSWKRYKELYGIDIFDLSVFDIVIDTSFRDRKSTQKEIRSYIDISVMGKSRLTMP